MFFSVTLNPDGVKGYRVWLRDEPGFKVSVSRDVIFNESDSPCLVDYSIPLSSDTSNEVEPTSSEVEPTSNEMEGSVPSVPFELVQSDNVLQDNSDSDTENTGPQPDAAQTPGSNNTSASDSATVPPNYVLARDREMRTNIRPPKRWGDEMNLVALAFNVH